MHFVILLLYVDDVLIATSSKSIMNGIKLNLMSEFKMTDIGEPKEFLGIKTLRDRANGTLFIHQRKFIESILKRFEMTECKTISTPMIQDNTKRIVAKASGHDLSDTNEMDINLISYKQVIDSLLYLTNSTRPDITFAVNVLSRKQSNFTIYD